MAKRARRQSNSRVLRLLRGFSFGILTLGIAAIFYIAVVFGIKKASDYGYDFAYQVFGAVSVEDAPGRDVKVTIMKGESSMNIASKLENAKLIVNKYSFFVKLKLKEYDIMPGTFVLNTSMSYDDILDTITDYSKSIDAEITVEDVESSP